MIYISRFCFPCTEEETGFIMEEKRTCYDTFYPFRVLSKNCLSEIDFETVTILYGSNGCGKTTALNVIAEKTGIRRDAPYNWTNFFEDYTDMCSFELADPVPEGSRVMTSDDVFNFMLDLRSINEGIDDKRDELIREHSNGESAFIFFVNQIKENALYLLDESENSLSPSRQKELVKFLEDSARFFGCQFIIATHSPFFLSMKGARIYDMDEDPVRVKKWTALADVRAYYDFFAEHENEF